MNQAEIVGANIKRIRTSKGLSQEKLANLANVDRTYIPKVEKGMINITVNSLAKIAEALNVNIKDLF
jgi:transcriptional regulator with XRE-family HTH domain